MGKNTGIGPAIRIAADDPGLIRLAFPRNACVRRRFPLKTV